MNNRNSLVFLDLNSIPLEDLPDEYKKLFEAYQQLKKFNDDDKQEIYELQRNLKTAKAAELHLSQELDLISSTQNAEIDKIQSKCRQEQDEYKRILLQIKDYNLSLEQAVEELNRENTKLKEEFEEISRKVQKTVNNTLSNEDADIEVKLEKENLELLAKLDDFQDNIQKSMMIIAERESQIEILKEQIKCLEENLLSKREELEEKTTLLESTQEQMIEMNAELALLKSAPQNNDRKGNSLFAEVDDQRQAMKTRLAAQKKNYLQMKKIYNESENEIRRLKRENSAMHNELQTCSSIFLNADKTYKEKLNERIYQLLKQTGELEEKLKWTQDHLISLGIEKGINWLDSILAFCKNETKELKAQLHTCRMQKGLLDLNYQNSLQEYAKWRFEALKSRCIIIDRESLLDENGIKYKNFTSNDFQFSEKELDTASPQISYGKRRSLLEHLDNKTENLKSKDLNKNNKSVTNTPENLKNLSIDICSSRENSIIEILDSPQNFSNIKSKPEHLSNQNSQISGNNFFEIYEDTSTFVPSLSSTNMKNMSTRINMEVGQNTFENSENKNNKLMLINNNHTNENKHSTIIKKDLHTNMNSSEEKLKKINKSFEIYEDTTKISLPLVKASDTNFKEIIVKNENKENNLTTDNNASRKQIKHTILNSSPSTEKMNNCFEIYEETTENYSLKSTNSFYENKTNLINDKKMVKKENNEIEYKILNSAADKIKHSFEIYEDATKNCFPLVKPGTYDEKYVKDENKENFKNDNKLIKKELFKFKSNTSEKSNSIDENVNLKDIKKTSQSILVKEKDVLSDNFKHVKFDEETIKTEAKSTIKVTTKRTKSNNIMRKIEFKKKNISNI